MSSLAIVPKRDGCHLPIFHHPSNQCWSIGNHLILFGTMVSSCLANIVRGGGGGGGRGGRGGGRTLGLCVKSFLPVCRIKTQEHLTEHRSACEVWVDSNILQNSTLNVTTLARSHSILLITTSHSTAKIITQCIPLLDLRHQEKRPIMSQS